MAGVMTQQQQITATVRFVALGDSFTEGVGDPALDAEVMRGWADLVAEGLAAHHGGIAYANLAIRGKLLEPIVTEQVDQALALDPLPTIATLNGGGNDMMRPGMDAATLIDLTEQGARRLLDAGVRPVLLAGPTRRAVCRSGRPCTPGGHSSPMRWSSSRGGLMCRS